MRRGEPGLRCEFTVDEAIEPVTLPKATGDEADQLRAVRRRSFRLASTGRNDGGCRVRRRRRRWRRLPPPYTWTAIDVDGDDAKLTVTIKVVSNLKEARARLKAINESILPELSRGRCGGARWTR